MAVLTRLSAMIIAPFVDLELRPTREYSAEGPLIFASNHRSMADFFIGMTTFHRLGIFPRIMIATDWLKGPLGWLGNLMGVIPVDRSRGAENSVDAAVVELGGGAKLMIMPEGKLYWDPSKPLSTGRGRPGMIRAGRRSGTPIVPVAVDGTEVIWPKGRPIPKLNPFRRTKIIVSLGEPYVIQSQGPDDDIEDAERIMADIRAMLEASVASRTELPA